MPRSTFLASLLLLAPLVGAQVTVLECGTTGTPVEVPVGLEWEFAIFGTEEEAWDHIEDEAVQQAAQAEMMASFVTSQHCDLCPPPDTDHCRRWVGTDGFDEDNGAFAVVDNGDGSWSTVIVVDIAWHVAAVCDRCAGSGNMP